MTSCGLIKWQSSIGSDREGNMLNFVHDDVIRWKHFPRYWPAQRPVTRSFDVFFDLRQNRRRRRWFPSRTLWRHCNELMLCLRMAKLRYILGHLQSVTYKFKSLICTWIANSRVKLLAAQNTPDMPNNNQTVLFIFTTKIFSLQKN